MWAFQTDNQPGEPSDTIAIGMRIVNLTRGSKMRYLRYLALLSVLILPGISAHAGVAFGVAVGPGYVGPPACAYGYYGYAPYACAPYGYYGPQWFAGGVFIGAGPWYHGFYGRGFYPGFYGRGGFGPGFRGGFAPGFRGGVARASVGDGFRGGLAAGGFHGGGRR
jgi:hypothetical protein